MGVSNSSIQGGRRFPGFIPIQNIFKERALPKGEESSRVCYLVGTEEGNLAPSIGEPLLRGHKAEEMKSKWQQLLICCGILDKFTTSMCGEQSSEFSFGTPRKFESVF